MSNLLRSILRRVLPGSTKQRIHEQLWRSMGLRWTLRSDIEIKILGMGDWVMYNEIFAGGEYDSAIDLVFQNNSSNLEILDLGANLGFFTFRVVDSAIARGLLAENDITKLRITAIEPHPDLFRRLQDSIEASEILRQTCRPIQGLVGKYEGEDRLGLAEFHPESGVHADGRGVLVPYVDLNEIFHESQQIDLIKCDIEGSEEQFLENYQNLLERTRVIVLEVHLMVGVKEEQCLSIIRDCGLQNVELIRRDDEQGIAVYAASRN